MFAVIFCAFLLFASATALSEEDLLQATPDQTVADWTVEKRTAPEVGLQDSSWMWGVGQTVTPVKYLTAMLGPNAATVPNTASTDATGMAYFTLFSDNTLKAIYRWNFGTGSAFTGAFIGFQVHVGSASQNGPILYGFCGGAPLPMFGTPIQACKQTTRTTGENNACPSLNFLFKPSITHHIKQDKSTASVCTITTTPSPCYNAGVGVTSESAAELLKMGTAEIYANYHTQGSLSANGGVPLGLIRGQLKDVGSSCAFCPQ